MAVLVQSVVGELHFEERQRVLHPVPSRRWGVWVGVCPPWGLGLCRPRDLPLLLLPLQRDGGGRNTSTVTKCEGSGYVRSSAAPPLCHLIADSAKNNVCIRDSSPHIAFVLFLFFLDPLLGSFYQSTPTHQQELFFSFFQVIQSLTKWSWKYGG